MPSAFVPFLKSGGKSPATAAPAATDTVAMAGAFAAMVPKSAGATPACAHPASPPPAQPVVTLKKDGDRVTHIHIQCACGQVVELECAY
jgi:hypothetical protein